MARPTNKIELIRDANERFDKMQAMLSQMTPGQREAEFAFEIRPKDKEAHWGRDRNVRDVLVHLYEWHRLLIDWLTSNRNGDAHPFLPKPYNWKTYGEMNVEFWKKHQSTSYQDAEKLLLQSHKKVMELIESFSEEELFQKAYFDWSGSTNVASYCISATGSHYDWAMKKLKRHVKQVHALV